MSISFDVCVCVSLSLSLSLSLISLSLPLSLPPGYRCNRYDAQKKAHELLTHRRDKIVEEFAELERMGRFLHYFERYKGHGQSLEVISSL